MTDFLPRLLVTGASGFVGQYACAAFGKNPNIRLLRLSRPERIEPGVQHSDTAFDLNDRVRVRECLASFKPTHILHLAAQSSVGRAKDAAGETWSSNLSSLIGLAEIIIDEAVPLDFIFVSSSEVYGLSFQVVDMVAEHVPVQPLGSYACSKCAGELFLQSAFKGGDNNLIVLRPFNHVGPGQREDFVVSSFAGQIARMEAGLIPPTLHVGRLDVVRDFLDVRDVVSAYESIVARSSDIQYGSVFNIASGVGRTIGSVLDDLRQLSTVAFEVCVAPNRTRPHDVRVAIGDAGRLRKQTNWRPMIPWKTTIKDILEDARRKTRVGLGVV